ncbi:hypothetical protein G5I_03690 [Acromyrmex echinatior]|uniref:Uncharacterized protein n=1 Tax=Acromyrmex echinatior TaxID=103372 RepID=F4WDN6_ACREC|nr:hypothetical protein G5I_03690 [Acromyrmex echinatior]
MVPRDIPASRALRRKATLTCSKVPGFRGRATSRCCKRIGEYRMDGRTDGAPSVGRWASVQRSDEDGKSRVATRLATAWMTRVYSIVGVVAVVSNSREIELEIVDDSMNPLIVSKSVASIRDPTKLNVGFQAKVESKNLPLSPIRGEHIKDTLRDKFAKASMQLELDVGVTSKKENANKIDGCRPMSGNTAEQRNQSQLQKRKRSNDYRVALFCSAVNFRLWNGTLNHLNIHKNTNFRKDVDL